MYLEALESWGLFAKARRVAGVEIRTVAAWRRFEVNNFFERERMAYARAVERLLVARGGA